MFSDIYDIVNIVKDTIIFVILYVSYSINRIKLM